jgi:hypothetical protein
VSGFLRIAFFGVASFFGLLIGTFVFWTIASLSAPIWIPWGFPPAETAEGKIVRTAWAEPMARGWSDPPTDISAKICPLVDLRLKQQILTEEGRTRSIWIGACLTDIGERVVVIRFDETGTICTATVDVPPPSCSL